MVHTIPIHQNVVGKRLEGVGVESVRSGWNLSVRQLSNTRQVMVKTLLRVGREDAMFETHGTCSNEKTTPLEQLIKEQRITYDVTKQELTLLDAKLASKDAILKVFENKTISTHKKISGK